MSELSPLSGNIVVAGVGGQGVVLASNIISEVCLSQGLDVKKAEVHGMAQRGGAVSALVRFGPEVHGVLIESGQVNWIVGFEWAEAVRWMSALSPEGEAFVSSQQIVPPSALRDRVSGQVQYPTEFVDHSHVRILDTRALAREAGNVKTAGVVLLGALSRQLPFSVETWHQALERWVPAKALAANWLAFDLGRDWKKRPMLRSDSPSRPAMISRRFQLAIEESWCKGCGICVNVCPERIWQLNDRNVVETIHAECCTGCGLCEKLCPDLAIDVISELSDKDVLEALEGGRAWKEN